MIKSTLNNKLLTHPPILNKRITSPGKDPEWTQYEFKNAAFAKITMKLFLVFILCLGSGIAKAQVSASFIADDTAGCAPMIVHFTNTSTGATNYVWDLGNGSGLLYGTDESGSYLTAGSYTVTLTAINGSSSSVYTMVINAYDKPTVSFSANDTSVCPNTPVTFKSTSVSHAWGGMTYNWNFGDGGFDTATSPVYSYPVPGYYKVTLFATNAPGCTGSLGKTAYMQVFTPPTPIFTGTPTNACKAPLLTTFTNTSTGTPALSYKWLFGDGATSTLASPSHNYISSGNYDVSLIVTDGNGCKDTLTDPGYVNIGTLAAAFTFPSTVCVFAPITFTNTSSSHISCKWYFGDGNTSLAESPTYDYITAGTFTVKLVVFDGTCYDSVSHLVTVSPLPTGSFSSTPVHPCPPPVLVTYNATVPGGTSVAWLFGDGTVGSGPSFVKNYPVSVIDFVDMILTSSAGCKDTFRRVDTIYNLNINATATYTEGCSPLSTSFSMYAYSVVYNAFTSNYDFFAYPYAITSYSWNFGDGSPLGSGPTPSHVYTALGVFTATVTITTANGCTANGTIGISVGKPPVPSFTMSKSRICADRSITFTSTSTGAIDDYVWDFGDGSPPPMYPGAPVVTHVYTTPGIFKVSLSVGDFGCFGPKSYILADTVDSANAVINYSYACIPPNEIDFRDASLGDDMHLWQFGDGFTSTASNPVHDYSALLTYSVTLTTFNITSGCRDTTHLFLGLGRPTVTFASTSGRLNICRDQADSFLAVVTGSGAPATRYKWYDNGVLVDSTHQKLAYIFRTLGLHTITLIITDSHGCLDTFSRPNYVLVAKPTDNFSFTPTSGCASLPVSFTDLSTDVVGATITKYVWAFGDGISSTVLVPTVNHTYTMAGTFAVKEIVFDNIGCSDTLTNPTKLTVYKPAASFTASPTVVCANNNVAFTNGSSGIASSLWFFGDGDTSTLTSPVHAYSAAGTYTVRLVVADAHGCVDTMTRIGYITVIPGPSASFTMSDSFAVCPPLNVHFTNTTVGGLTYKWKFGDGDSSVAKNPGEPYLTPGIYTVMLAAKNSNGCSDTAYAHVTIFGYKGAFTYAPISGCSPLPVHFKAVLTAVATNVWDFGDGNTSGPTLLDTISHVYAAPGQYVPKLILIDTSTKCSSFSLGVDTIKVDTIIPGFTITPNPICQNNTVSFADTSHSLFSTSKSWLWSFGGGFTSTAAAPTHLYTASGTFPVTLKVTDGTGCVGFATNSVTVNASPLPISGNTAICVGVTTSLTDAAGPGTWASSNTTVATIGVSSGVLKGVNPGTATITYTVITGCQISETITVRPLPAPISGGTGICYGLTTSLSDSSPFGTWSSSNTAVATIGSTSGFVRSVSIGTTTITYTLPSGCANTTKVTVTTSPVKITAPPTLCLGSTITISDTITGGSWTSTNTSVATIDLYLGTIVGVGLGTTSITYSLGTGCIVGTTMTVIPVPGAIKGVGNLCAGNTTLFTDGTPGGFWSSSNNAVATVGTGGIVSGISGGVDTVIYTLLSGCSVSKPITINSSSPITGTPNVCVGSSGALSDASRGGTWSSSNTGVATIGMLSGTYLGVSGGTAIITYMLPTGCFQTTIVSVIAKPAVITGPPSVCVGQTISLSDITKGGTWVSADSLTAKIDPVSGLVTGMASGTVVMSYSIGTGCTEIAAVVVDPISPVLGVSSVCIGQTILLVDTSLGGVWSSSNSAVAVIGKVGGIVTGMTTGTTTITYALPTGCSATHTVSVMALPPAITGKTTVCAGLITALSDPAGGGAWSSANTAIATAGSGSGIVTGISAGTALIVYTQGGCPITTTVTVNPLPASITGNTGVCIGGTSSLSDAGGGIWTSSNTVVATIGVTSGFVHGILPGTSTITYILPTGCLITTTVNVNPLPSAIIGKTSVCIGATTTLSDATLGGTWGTSDPYTATVNSSGVVTGVFPGTATIIYSVKGCTASVIVTVNPLPSPITGSDQVCVGSTANLSDVGSGTWLSSTSAIATIGFVSGTVTGINAGVDTITYTLGTGCITTTTVMVNPLPLPITGTTNICTTLQTTLIDITATGTWTSGNTVVATIDSSLGLVTGMSPGTAIITFTLGTGCITTTTVTVHPFPSAIMGRSQLCEFTPTTLSDAVKGGVWSSSNTFIATIGSTSGITTGLSLGTVYITYTVAGACYIADTFNVVPLPVTFLVSGGGTICASDTGAHIFLNGSAVGINYFLYNKGIVATGPLHGTAFALDFGLQKVAGAYTVVGINSVTGCSSTMKGGASITVNPTVVPAVYVSTGVGDTICSGALTTFTATGVNGGSSPAWQWNVNGTNVGLTGNYSYIPADGDIVTCTMTSNENCAVPKTAANSVKMTVTVPQMPSVTLSAKPGDTICQGENIALAAHPVYGGYMPDYTWMVNSVKLGSGPTFSYQPANGDVVYCTMTSNYPCVVAGTVNSATAKLTVDSPIIPQVTIQATPGTNIGIGWKDTLTAIVTNAGPYGATYQWMVNGMPVHGATTYRYISDSFSHAKPDSISCQVTSSGLCTMTTHNWVYINVSDVGVKQPGAVADVSVLPNPNKGEFVIRGSLGTGSDEEVSLEITDLLGQVVYREKVMTQNGGINKRIQLSNTLANSMYILTLHSGAENKVFHIVLER